MRNGKPQSEAREEANGLIDHLRQQVEEKLFSANGTKERPIFVTGLRFELLIGDATQHGAKVFPLRTFTWQVTASLFSDGRVEHLSPKGCPQLNAGELEKLVMAGFIRHTETNKDILAAYIERGCPEPDRDGFDVSPSRHDATDLLSTEMRKKP